MRLCRAVRETLDAERVIVWLYDAPGQTVSPYATDSPAAPGALEQWAETPLDELPVACTVLLESRAVQVEDAQADPSIPPQLAAELALESVRFEPLLAGRPVGMLSVEPAAAAARPELHSLLPLVAAGAGRVASRRESARERRDAEFLLELTQAATTAESVEQMLGTICERAAAELRVHRGTIFLLQGSRLTARISRNADGSYDRATWAQLRAEPAPPLAEAVLQSGKPVVARDPGSPLIPGWWSESLESSSALAVPLSAGGRVFGTLVLDDPGAGRFSQEDVRLAAAAAGHVAGIVDQALESDERTLHLRAATAIRRLLEEGAGAVSVREAGEVLARVIRDAVGAERATLMLQDENEQIEHVISVGADGEFDRVLRSRIGRVPARELRIWRLTTRQPKPIFVENARASRLIPLDLVEELNLHSYVAVPLLSATRPLGLVLCSHSDAPRRWSAEERQLVAQVALEGSLVVENAVLRATEHEWLDRLSHQAFHDSLTKLPNRALFIDRLQHAIDRMIRRQESIAVLFLDLDEFKPINDSFGHEAGDRLLVAVGRRLQGCLRPEDTIARLGGDEFTVLIEDITDVRYAIRVAERIAESLREPFRLNGSEAAVTASIGIAVSTGRESTPDELIRSSDRAMYEAKHSGKARHVVYHEGLAGTDPRDSYGQAAGRQGRIEAKVVEHAEAIEEAGPLDEAGELYHGIAPAAADEAEEVPAGHAGEVPAELEVDAGAPEEPAPEEQVIPEEPLVAPSDEERERRAREETERRSLEELAGEIEIHREPIVAPEQPSEAVAAEPAGNGRPAPAAGAEDEPADEPEPPVASTLSEARRRRRRRFPPR